MDQVGSLFYIWLFESPLERAWDLLCGGDKTQRCFRVGGDGGLKGKKWRKEGYRWREIKGRLAYHVTIIAWMWWIFWIYEIELPIEKCDETSELW